MTFAHPSFSGLIGVAREDITPPDGIYARNWGAAEHDRSEGLHDRLTATALTLQTARDAPPLVLLALDLGWWRTAEDEWRLRETLLNALNLAPEQLMIALSHTHSGPSVCREDADKPGGDAIPSYLGFVADMAVSAARSALAGAKLSELAWRYGRCDLAANRDLPAADGTRIACGFNPRSSADDTLLVGRVAERDGHTRAVLVNYACHPTTLAWQNRAISPDYVGPMRGIIEQHVPGAQCLFLQGASGELAPREQYTGDTRIAEAHGRTLGFAALSALADMLPPGVRLEYAGIVESGAPLGVWTREPSRRSQSLEAVCERVELPLKPLQSLPGIEREMAAGGNRVLAERLLRKRRIRQFLGEGLTARVPVWVWRAGDAMLLGHPDEAYSLLQTELRRRFPDRAVAVMNVVNGPYCGYLPPADLYDKDMYQVWQTPFDRGSLERLVRACAASIESLSKRS
jgi:hypothetical protein